MLSLLCVMASIAVQQHTMVQFCTQQSWEVRTVGGYFLTRSASAAPGPSIHPCSG